MHEDWHPPPELAGPTPRRFKWNGVGIAGILLRCLLILVGLGILGNVWRAADESHRLKQEGQIKDATVTRKWSEPGRSGRYYKVAYEFSAGGKTLSGEAEIPQQKWKELESGGHVPVKYVPDMPEYNQLSSADETMTPYWLPLTVFALWIFLLTRAVNSIRMEMRLLRYGQAAPGRITYTKATSGGASPKYGYIMKYEYQLSDGTVLNGNTRQSRFTAGGSEVIVIYDPKDPRISEIYPTATARIKS
jgi:hypothetical protein